MTVRETNLSGLRLALVGPVAPPEGGMAAQTAQLAELLRKEGAQVRLVVVNEPYRPKWIGRARGVRAVFRLVPYVFRLWRAAGEARVFHVMANSGWSWHLFAAPAVLIARMRKLLVVVNYRGGEAERFLASWASAVLPVMRRAHIVAVPSGFLCQVFARHGVAAHIVPNVVDLERFRPAPVDPDMRSPLLVVARNLEAIYDIPTALRAFASIRTTIPAARMAIAGSGPEASALAAEAEALGIASAIEFRGRLGREEMAQLYRTAALVLNPSRVDNMPNSVLEAMASGVPVVSTNVGGVPHVLRDGVTGVLVNAGNHGAMARSAVGLLTDRIAWQRIRDAALADVRQYAWAQVRHQWNSIYAEAIARDKKEARSA